jgi:hypothetical protein
MGCALFDQLKSSVFHSLRQVSEDLPHPPDPHIVGDADDDKQHEDPENDSQDPSAAG